MTNAVARLAAGDFEAAVTAAQEATRIAPHVAARELAAPVLSSARRGVFEAALVRVNDLLAAQSWIEAWDAVLHAESRLPGDDAADVARVKAARQTAGRGVFELHITRFDVSAQAAVWAAASDDAIAAEAFAHDDASRARAAQAVATARQGRFDESLAAANLQLANRAFKAAEAGAAAALRIAPHDAARALATRALAAAKKGVFEQDVMADIDRLLSRKRWAEATAAAQHAVQQAPDGACQSRAAKALARAKQGAFDEQLATANSHLARKEFERALTAAEQASRMAPHAAAQALATQAQAAAQLGIFEAAAARVAYWVERRDWDDADEAARDALRKAGNDAALRSRAHAAAESVRAGHASEAAEPEYADAIDDFIRKQNEFRGNTPCSYRCPLSLVLQRCPRPAAIKADLSTLRDVLSRYDDQFEVGGGGGALWVRVLWLTPFRGEEGHRVFGEFRCKCGKRWKSAATYCDKHQGCQGCNTRVYPWSQRALEQRERGGDDDDEDASRPHDQERCQRCRELGRCCMPTSQLYSGGGYGGRGGRGRGGRR
jgi:hypothetical protein